MHLIRRRGINENKTLANGLYVHSNPPRVLQITSAHVKQLIRTGDVERLEQVVLEGQGKKLIGNYSADYKTRTFLKSVPIMMSKISLLHDAVNSDRLEELKILLEEEPSKKKKFILSKDESGVGLLHKAVYYDLKDIYKYLIQQFPQMVSMKDSEGRTAYHYTPMCKDSAGVQKLLVNAGADANSLDFKQHSAKYYANHIQELELPSVQKTHMISRKSTASSESLNFKKSNIRIWIHQRNLTNLQQVVWEGHGSRLLVEHSNNPKIKKFLEAVPHIMGLIKDVHGDVQNGDLDGLKTRVSPPIPPLVLSGKDSNGLTPLHKAAGLGKQEIAEFIVSEYPNSVNLQDNEGRTPLHYAALLKDNGQMTKFLIDNGADESALDSKQKTAAYYKTRNSELDAKLLSVIPECPRSANNSFAANFDWSMLTSNLPLGEISKAIKKIEKLVNNDTENNNKEPETEETAEHENEPEKVNGEAIHSESEEHTGANEVEDHPTEEEPETKEEDKAEDENENPVAEEETNAETHENGDANNNDEEAHDEETPDEEKNETDNNVEETKEEHADEPTTNNDEAKEENAEAAVKTSAEGSRTRPSSKHSSRPSSKMVENNKEPESEGEGVIEGVVNGENEIESLNEEGQGKPDDDKNDDDDIKAMVETGNMEQLAALVLNGDGEKLIGQTSENPELQTFLENVPVYMSKINRIHIAARDGSLRDLQAALDRRKFAIAKDHISPKGATPLHVAVIFGNTSIVRYLAGRFPETIQAVDEDGRTPLHYAATLADNGHYYNLLVHLGADTRIEDKFGQTAEYYRSHSEGFSHRTLLTDFGTEENAVEEILNDKAPEDIYSSKKNLDDEDMINVLEKCYVVLHGRRNSNAISAASAATNTSQPSSTSSLLSKHLKRYIFDAIKLRLTKFDHNLYDLIWPSVKKLPSEMSFRVALEQDFPAGIVAPDFCVYKVFQELLIPIIKDFNCIDLSPDLPLHPHSKFLDAEDIEKEIELDLDHGNKWIISDNSNVANGQVDMPFFATEEGRYLASSLGDPLIKGLTEVANKRPEDPIAYLATYLYNFANNRSNLKSRGRTQESARIITGSPQMVNDNNSVPASIDVVTVEPDDESTDDESAFSSTSRDEHGQSMLHFAAARSHGRNALFQLLLETEINVAYRDELYRTARDISIQANIPQNTEELDRYVLHIATKGDTDKLVELLLDGYDHITDVVDADGVPIVEAVANENQPDTVSFLQSILTFEEKRERVHHAIRQGSANDVMTLLADENDTGSGKLLSIGKNSYGRCTLHIAVLCQQEEIVDYVANTFPDTLKLGDNLERTALHYAMGVEKMETISRLLIKAGAKRVTKDLKGRQPTYYFLNKSEILRLQEEEETF